MAGLPEPDDVDFLVEESDTDPESIRQTIEYIKELERRPEHAEQVKQAHAILESLRLNSKIFQMPDPDALLEHWKRVVEELNTEEAMEGSLPESPSREGSA